MRLGTLLREIVNAHRRKTVSKIVIRRGGKRLLITAPKSLKREDM